MLRLNRRHKFNRLTALVLSLLMLLGSTGCLYPDAEFAGTYITATMDMYYYGDTSVYFTVTNASEKEADYLHKNAVRYFTSCVANYCGVDLKLLKQDLYNDYYEWAEDYLQQAKYNVASVDCEKNRCQVKITIEPLDYKTPMDADISLYQHIYASRMRNLKGEARADFAPIFMNYYAKDILRLLKKHLEHPVYHDKLQYEMLLLVDNKGNYQPARDEDWLVIDRLVMGVEGYQSYEI